MHSNTVSTPKSPYTLFIPNNLRLRQACTEISRAHLFLFADCRRKHSVYSDSRHPLATRRTVANGGVSRFLELGTRLRTLRRSSRGVITKLEGEDE